MISMLTLNARIQTRLDFANAFNNRKERIIQTLLAEAPDIVGFQEITGPMFDTLQAGMDGYVFIGQRCKQHAKGEYTAIAYRKDTLVPEDGGTFWLSPLPGKVGSRYTLQSPDPRTCTWGLFRHVQSGTRFRCFNTHLDHLSPIARARGLRVIFKQMAKLQRQEKLPLFFSGDLNFTPRNTLYSQCTRQVIANHTLIDLTADISSTFNWFGLMRRPIKLDYIFTDMQTARDQFTVRVLEKDKAGQYLSDHNAIRIDWTPKEAPLSYPLLSATAGALSF